ncbi:Xaa-Pro peptidase family protein [Conexibacter stalactiti]|uniref:Xaa-Pro peptidase family protein n=1 Tax=Conexibacter stalactiti TaxID=1940611 RepID=A0ABU4HUI3_9ACTN|nr:Xaa-Pro peptidase family protein [Conexibacter stalactiti]MDW5596936.1 Xaa-Pro peptidase family protein [Conexibacter stalactiti]MEC5037578.1 Xaa-Pro peptidase family protein [Conexibacter stalactiti]
MSAPHAPLARACAALRDAGLDGALLASPSNVTYVSGWEAPLIVGPFADIVERAPVAYAVVSAREQAAWLVVADVYGGSAAKGSRIGAPESFGTLGMVDPVDHPAELTAALRRTFSAAGLRSGVGGGGGDDGAGRIAVERRALPVAVLDALGLPLDAPDAGPPLAQARMIKTAEEIERLRFAAQVTAAGHLRLLELAPTAAGASELEVWGEVTTAMERLAGGPLTVTGELTVGARTRALTWPNGPFERTIAAGDTGLMDISPRVNGYWADCTNTVVFGAEPSDDQRRYARAAQEACAAAIAELRPGAKASQAAVAHRETMAAHGFGYAHYSGHQIGVTVNELPRLVFYDDTVVEAGMVFAVEPGVYAGEEAPTGARAELMALVTEQGPEVLSQFPWGI